MEDADWYLWSRMSCREWCGGSPSSPSSPEPRPPCRSEADPGSEGRGVWPEIFLLFFSLYFSVKLHLPSSSKQRNSWNLSAEYRIQGLPSTWADWKINKTSLNVRDAMKSEHFLSLDYSCTYNSCWGWWWFNRSIGHRCQIPSRWMLVPPWWGWLPCPWLPEIFPGSPARNTGSAPSFSVRSSLYFDKMQMGQKLDRDWTMNV